MRNLLVDKQQRTPRLGLCRPFLKRSYLSNWPYKLRGSERGRGNKNLRVKVKRPYKQRSFEPAIHLRLSALDLVH